MDDPDGISIVTSFHISLDVPGGPNSITRVRKSGRQRQKGNEGFTLKSVTFAITGLVFRDDLVLHCGGTLPTPVWGDLQFRAAWLRSSVKSQGGPTRIYKFSHLFISWFELVVVADFSGRNGRIRP